MIESEIFPNLQKKKKTKTQKNHLKKHIFDITEKLLLSTARPWHARVDFWIEIINNTPEILKNHWQKNTYRFI